MKHIICAIFIGLFSVTSVAEDKTELDKSIVEFSKIMGIDSLLAATMQQTRESINNSMTDLANTVKKNSPNMSAVESKELEEIFAKYSNSILDSVDIDRAAYIYARIIAEGLSKEEVEVASEYYESPEGQNLLKVVGTATTELSQYLLDVISKSSRNAQGQLFRDLETFKKRALDTQ